MKAMQLIEHLVHGRIDCNECGLFSGHLDEQEEWENLPYGLKFFGATGYHRQPTDWHHDVENPKYLYYYVDKDVRNIYSGDNIESAEQTLGAADAILEDEVSYILLYFIEQ